MKRLTAILGLVCIAMLLLVGAVPRLVNTQAFLDRLDYELEAMLGLSVRIEGGLRLEVFPHPGIEIRDVFVDNPDGFGGKPAARLSRALVRVELLPLLEREIRVRQVRLEGLAVDLVRNAEGAWNINSPSLEEAAKAEGEIGPDWKFVVQEVSLKDGRVSLDDLRSGRHVVLSKLTLDIGGDHGQSFTLTGGADIETGELGGLGAVKGHMRWTGKGHGGAGGDIVVESSSFGIAATANLPGGHAADLALDAVLGLDMGAGSVELRSLDVRMPGLTLQSRAKADKLFGETSAEGDLTVGLTDAKAFFSLFGDEAPEALVEKGGEAHIAFAADKEAATIHAFSLRAGSNEAEAAVRVERYADPMIFVDLEAKHLDLDEWAVPNLPDLPDSSVREEKAVAAGSAVRGFVEEVQGLDIEFRLRAESLEYEAVVTRNVNVEVKAHGGKVESPHFSADLARGRLTGTIGASVNDDMLKAAVTLAVDGPEQGNGANGKPERQRNLKGVRLIVDGTPESWKGSLDIPECNPREVLKYLGLDDLKGIDPKALTQAALGVRFSGGENSLDVQQAELLLDGAKLDVLARMPDVAAGRVQAQIRADRFDLDRYLPLLGEPSPRAKKSTKLDLDRPLGLGDLATGESSYVFKAGQLKARGVVLKAVEASWATDQGRLRASLGAQAFGGALSLSGETAPVENGPLLVVETRAAGLDAAQLQDVFRVQQGIFGKLGMQGQVSARGDRLSELLASLDVRLKLSLEGGSRVLPGTAPLALGSLASNLTLKSQAAGAKGFDYQYTAMLRRGTASQLPYGQAELSGKLTLPRSLSDVQTEAQLSFRGGWNDVPGKDKALSASTRFSLDTDKGTARVADLVARGMGSELRFSASGQGLKSDPVWRGSFAIDPFVPRRVFESMRGHAIATRDPGVLALAKGSSEWVWGKGILALSGLRFTLDDTDLSGNLSLSSFFPLDAAFELEATSLDVDRYRHPLDAPETDDEPVDMPEELLAALRVKGALRVGKFTIYGITGSNIRTTVTAEKGEITVPGLTADTFGGKLKATASAQVIKTRLAMRYDFTATDFNLGELLVGMADAPYAGGKTTLSATLTMAGATNDELLETMDGRGRLDVKDGWLLFSKPKQQKVSTSIKDLIPGKIEGQAKGTIRPEGATAFATAGTNILINDGVIGSSDLVIDQPWTYKATAKGGTDLVKEEVDYRIQVRVVKLASIPVAIRGPWEDIKVEVNTGAAIVDTATGLVLDAVTLPFRILESLIP